MRVAPLGVALLLAGCAPEGYRVVVYVPGGPAPVERIEVNVIGSCAEVGSMGIPPARPLRSVVVDGGQATPIGPIAEGSYGLYARAWLEGCLLYAAGCSPIRLAGGGEGDLEVFLATLQSPLSCDVDERCEKGECVARDDCAGITCPEGELCRDGECADASADLDGDGYAAEADCDDLDDQVVPGTQVPCSTDCGVGQRTCLADASWAPCSAPTECDCVAGEVREEACGRCGRSERPCGADGRWGEPSACTGEGDCAPGSYQALPCGRCGGEAQSCSPTCAWVSEGCVEPPDDEDHDGFVSLQCGGSDCDDTDPLVNPEALDGWAIETVIDGAVLSPSLALGPGSEVHLVYRDDSADVLAHAWDDGDGWRLEEIAGSESGSNASLAVDGDGMPHVAFFDRALAYLAYCYRPGDDWFCQAVDTGEAQGSIAPLLSLAIDDQYAEIAYVDLAIGLRWAQGGYNSWSFASVAEGTVGSPSLALREDSIHVAFHDVDNQALIHSVKAGAGFWSDSTLFDTDGKETQLSLAVDVDGRPHVAFRDPDDRELVHAVDPADGWVLDTVDADNGVWGKPSIGTGSDGSVHIAYLDFGNRDLRHAVLDDGQWRFETLDSAGDTGGSPSLAVDDDGTVHIAYGDADAIRHAESFQDGSDQDCDGLADR